MPAEGPTLIGSALPPTRSLMTAWAIGAGWLMSCAVYATLIGSNSPALLFLAVPPALLSGAAVCWAGGGRQPTASQIVGSTLFASFLCPLATVLPILLFEAVTRGIHPAGEVLGMVICFSVIGAFLMVPFGMWFGAVFALAWRAIDSGRGKGHRSALEIAWLAFGSGWLLIGGILVVASWQIPLRPYQPFPLTDLNLLAVTSAALAGLGAVILLAALVHHVRRRRLAERVRRGELSGFAVVPASEIVNASRLPALFPAGTLDAVLVRREGPTGPFRDAPDVPVARVSS